jgi:predicted transcriptional regulator YdeE
MNQAKQIRTILLFGIDMKNSHAVVDPGFKVIGITIRTTNIDAINHGSIQKLWQRFFMESIPSRIPNKIDNAIIALYYDFENDKNGHYNLLLGSRVSSIDEIPEGMVAQRVPEQKRIVFISGLGATSHIGIDLWQKIWVLEDQNKITRSYIADYELYDERSQNPEKAQMTIHIGIK